MNKILQLILVGIFLLVIIPFSQLKAQFTLQGIVADSVSKLPLQGAIITISDAKLGAITDSSGYYEINHIRGGVYLVTASYIGFLSVTKKVSIQQNGSINFVMQPTIIESKELIVTGVSKATEALRTPMSIEIVTAKMLQQTTSTNIVDALASMPGIAQITTGGSISKPVIRGLGYNRVVVVNDGIRQEGQQWGDEHGLEMDEQGISKVELLKGPASLSYGSDAMAGVINFIDNINVKEGTGSGSINANYQTNNGLAALGGHFALNKKRILWAISGGYKAAHAYENKADGYVFNSAFEEQAVKNTIGLSRKWGYGHLTYSYYRLKTGLVEGERDSASGKFTSPVLVNDSTVSKIVTTADLKSYQMNIPRQLIEHQKLVYTQLVYLKKSTIKTILGAQQNQRQEYAAIATPTISGLHFLLRSFHYDFSYNKDASSRWNWSVGSNGMQEHSTNKGSEFLIPNYTLTDAGFYFISHHNQKQFDVQAGLRWDIRSIKTTSLYLNSNEQVVAASSIGAIEKFKAIANVYNGVSGGVGLAYQNRRSLYYKLNLAKAYRTPNVAELAANGVHEGTLRYELGNANLKAESSWQLDAIIGWRSTHFAAELDLFDNRINNFVYSRKIQSYLGTDSMQEGLSVFQFQSGLANLHGGEFSLDFHPHPLDWLHFEQAVSYVRAIQLGQTTDSTKNLPAIPATKFKTAIRLDLTLKNKHFKNSYVKIEMENYLKQNKVYSAYATETATPGYTLYNMGIGTSIYTAKQKQLLDLIIAVNNVTDVIYQSHLSRLKYGAVNNNTGRTGVFNMGRNFSVKLIAPINF